MKKVLKDIFLISSAMLILFSIIELFLPKFASPYINFNLLLIAVLISGILKVIVA